MIEIQFTGSINNDSLQVGDLAYYVTPSESGGFNQSTDAPTLIGKIKTITTGSITVDNSSSSGYNNEEPSGDDFIMFAKDSRINLSGLIGYYAEVEIRNDSDKKAEMYCVASEITPSSK